MRVVGGEVYLESYWTAHAKSEVSQIIVHEDFDYNTLWNDVALLKVSLYVNTVTRFLPT